MNGHQSRWASLALTMALAAGCGGSPSSPAGSATSPSTLGVVTQLRISGLPASLSSGAAVQLKAELVFQSGMLTECRAAWAVDDTRIASVSPSGVLTAGMSGYTHVSGSCEGFTARVEARIVTTNPYRLVIVARDSDVLTEFGVAASMEFLDGPRAGEKVTSSSVFGSGLTDVEWPVKVRFTADSYAPTDFVLSEATGTRRNPASPLFDFFVPMTFAPDAQTDTYVRTMSRTMNEIAHPFQLRAPGSVQIRTWWSVDYNDRLTIELWCEGRMLRSVEQQAGSSGGGFTQDVSGPGSCEVRLRQLKPDADTNYRVAIRYPH